MSDGPFRSLPMSPRWKRAAKCAYNEAYSAREIADALEAAATRDCLAELSQGFLNRANRLIIGPDEPGLFTDPPIAELKAMHRECSSTMESEYLRNAIDALCEGHRGEQAVTRAVQDTASDRSLAGLRQIEEHMYRNASEHRTRAVRSRLEGAHRQVDFGAVAARMLRAPGAATRASSASYTGLEDGVPL